MWDVGISGEITFINFQVRKWVLFWEKLVKTKFAQMKVSGIIAINLSIHSVLYVYRLVLSLQNLPCQMVTIFVSQFCFDVHFSIRQQKHVINHCLYCCHWIEFRCKLFFDHPEYFVHPFVNRYGLIGLQAITKLLTFINTCWLVWQESKVWQIEHLNILTCWNLVHDVCLEVSWKESYTS